jgi:replicative DNA helicase
VNELVPPHDLDAEHTVLACCMADRYALAAVVGADLKPEDFYRHGHQEIYRAIRGLFAKGDPVDLLTLKAALGGRLESVGGYGYLVDVAGSIPTTAHIEHYAAIVAEKADRRRAIAVVAESWQALHDPETPDPVTDALGKLMAVGGGRSKAAVVDFHAVVEDRLNAIHQAARNPATAKGGCVTTGIYDVDKLVRIEPGDMVVIAARPSAGKTALALQIMANIAQDAPVLFFSLEMSKEAMASRYLTARTGVSSRRQMGGYVGAEELDAIGGAWTEALGLQFRIDDRPGLTVAQIAAAAHREAVTLGRPLGAIFIDHMGKVRPADSRASGHAKLTQVSNDLKQLFRSMKVPGVVLNQLNREVEKRNDKPRMSDIRESGSIEEDADVIGLLHRPGRDEAMGQASLYFAKNRNGQTGDVDLIFNAAKTCFEGVTYDPNGGTHA